MRHLLPALAAVLLTAAPGLAAGPTVAVVVGPDAPKLERLAATELSVLLVELFEAQVAIAEKPAAGVDHIILLGSPQTNPLAAKAVGDKWPKLTDQGHVLRSAKLGDRAALVAGGGSPVATLWAVYELGHHFGVRSFLHGDVLPEKRPELKLDGIDVTLEPAAKVRAWQVLGESPIDTGVWGLEDHKRLVRQLAKLKFNRVVVPKGADGSPLVFGGRFAVAGDTPGRKAFKGAKSFENPDLAGKAGDARAALAEAIGQAAAEYGLAVGDTGPGVATLALRGFLPRVPADLPTGKEGFLVVAEVPGDLSPAVYALSRRALDPKLGAKEAVSQLFTPILGAASAERVAVGFARLDEAAALVEKNDPTFATVSPDLILKQLKSADVPPEWWKKASKLYAGAMDEMYRAIRATFHDAARPTLLYYAKRCEFAVHYFGAVEAARLAGQAKTKGEKDAAAAHLEKATEGVYNALNALGDAARDPADRGVIAALAEYAYRPLTAELKAAEKK